MKPTNRLQVSGRTSRRHFTKSVAATLVAAPLSASLVGAQTPATTKEAAAPPKPEAAPAPPKPSPVAEAYGDVVRARFGDKLTPEERDKVKEALERGVRAADGLRRAKLQNGDEPDFVFSA